MIRHLFDKRGLFLAWMEGRRSWHLQLTWSRAAWTCKRSPCPVCPWSWEWRLGALGIGAAKVVHPIVSPQTAAFLGIPL